MKPFLCLLAASLLFSSSAGAQTIASKIAYQGAPRYLGVSGLTSRQQNGFLAVAVELTNSDGVDQEAFYRTTWLDEDGFPVWDEEAWKPVLLHGKELRSVVIVAPTPKARDFRLHFSATLNSTLGN